LASRSNVDASRLTAQIVPPPLWDRTVAAFDDIAPEQVHVFAKARWPQLMLEPTLFWAGGEVAGGCLVMHRKLGLGAGWLAFAKAGPMVANSRHPRARELYREMIALLVASYAKRRGFLIAIQPRTSTGAFNAEHDDLLEAGFRPAHQHTSARRAFVDLRLSDEQQRRSLDPKWRHELEKSERAGLAFEVSHSERWDEFERLRSSGRRKGGPGSTLSGILGGPMAIDNEALRPQLFVVRHLREIIAGAVVFKAGRRAVLIDREEGPSSRQLRANHFLQWNIVRWLRDHTAADWYELGPDETDAQGDRFNQQLAGEAGAVRDVPAVAVYPTAGLQGVFGRIALRRDDLVSDLLTRRSGRPG